MLASADDKALSTSDAIDKALADLAQRGAGHNDATMPRRVPRARTRPIAAGAARKSAPASSSPPPDGNCGRAAAANDSFAGLSMAQAALAFASARHAGQYREVDHAPFVVHPIEVGSLLHADGQPDEVIAAGLLHDLLEKTRTTRAELQRRFGACIAGLVESVSDDPSIADYGSRKRDLRDRIAHAGSNTVAIFAADKISKVRELSLLPTPSLDETTRAKLAHYRASSDMLRRVAGNSALVDLLDAELARLSHTSSELPLPAIKRNRNGRRIARQTSS